MPNRSNSRPTRGDDRPNRTASRRTLDRSSTGLNGRTVAIVFALAFAAYCCRPGWSQDGDYQPVEIAETNWAAPASASDEVPQQASKLDERPGLHTEEKISITGEWNPKLKISIARHAVAYHVEPPPPPEPPKPLNELVDAATAKRLADLLRAFAFDTVLEETPTGPEFLKGLTREAEKEGLTGNRAWPRIVEQLSAVAKDGPIERIAVKAELERIATELGVKPDPPKPPEPISGKRRVVIIRESSDDTTQQAILFTALRSGPDAAYLTSKGHHLEILDDDDQNATVAALKTQMVGDTTVFVLDAASGVVLLKESLPDTAGRVIELVKRAGG